MLAAAVLAVTLGPALRLLLVPGPASTGDRPGKFSKLWKRLLAGQIPSEEQHPITGPLIRLYDPVVRWSLRCKRHVIAARLPRWS